MHYETAVAIGRGASGEVYRAWDPRAGRPVALKLFPADDPESLRRLQREAAAQGRLDHPSICEIYEVGRTDDGRGFIAMRLVDGRPLDQVAAELPLRRRVELVRQVCDAVGHAHRAGLVHRDLKPGNLLVEEKAGGALHPFVLDFGIVHLPGATRLTETGQVLGTPGYLSPEQARGAPEVDARSDVFSLGVVLYQVLTGRHPFAAPSGVGALFKVLEHEPPLAHAVDRKVPPVLGHVARKAMEKDPRRRYRDAGELGRDLARFLDAGAVSARAVGWLGRRVRQVERHPLPWLLGALLLVVALGSLGWAGWSRLRTQQEARLAESFTRRSADLEARLRFLELLPRGSIAPGRQRLLGSLDDLRGDVEAADGTARAAGEYAIARVELALGRSEPAARRFRTALDLGIDDPAASLGLGRALLERSRRDLRRVDLLADPGVRSAERERLKQEVRRSVLPYLRAATTSAPTADGSRDLARALAALLLDRLEEADALAARVARANPWMVEADLVRAETHRRRSARARGEDRHADALAALEREHELVAAARERAPSAPALAERACENRLLSAQLQLAKGETAERWEASFAAAEAACRAAREILPGAGEAADLLVEISWRRSLERLRRGDLEGARADADRAVARARARLAGDGREEAPGTGAGWTASWNLGNALFAQASVRRQLGQPVIGLYEQAAEALAHGLQEAPGIAFGWQSLGHVWTRHGVAVESEGGDPRPSLARAIDAYERGLFGSRVQQSRIYNALCIARSELAYYGIQHPGRMPAPEIEDHVAAAVAACREALSRDPDYLSALSNLGLAHWTEAEWLIAAGRSPRAAGEAGRRTYRRLLELAPDHLTARNNLAGLVATVAAWRLDNSPADGGGAFAELLDALGEAEATAAALVDRIPADASIHRARLATLRAAVLCGGAVGRFGPLPAPADDRRQTPEAAWTEARQAVGELPAAGVPSRIQAVRRAELHRRAARCAADRGDDAGARREIGQGLRAVDAALAVDPEYADAHTEAEHLRRLAARTGSAAQAAVRAPSARPAP